MNKYHCPQCGFYGIIQPRAKHQISIGERVKRFLARGECSRSDLLRAIRGMDAYELTTILNELNLAGQIAMREVRNDGADKSTTLIMLLPTAQA
jgi:hypothetical protein